jgi:hypothetical protein
MEFIVYLDTTANYNANKVVEAFHKALALGLQELKNKDDIEYCAIIADLIENSPQIERV